jgi:hypothetical protein
VVGAASPRGVGQVRAGCVLHNSRRNAHAREARKRSRSHHTFNSVLTLCRMSRLDSTRSLARRYARSTSSLTSLSISSAVACGETHVYGTDWHNTRVCTCLHVTCACVSCLAPRRHSSQQLRTVPDNKKLCAGRTCEKSAGCAAEAPKNCAPPLWLHATWPSRLLRPSCVTMSRAMRVTCWKSPEAPV